MVECSAHNGEAVGSIPTKYILYCKRSRLMVNHQTHDLKSKVQFLSPLLYVKIFIDNHIVHFLASIAQLVRA